jgi:hypothetical protein
MMFDCPSSEQSAAIPSINSGRSAPQQSPRKWLVAFWMLSLVVGTTVWWAGLAWAAVLLTERAIS